ncbi:MAG: DUF6088 family protein [Sedimenticola sp.]
MSVAETIRKRTQRIPRAEPFTNARFLKLGSRASVDMALHRLVEEGIIRRVIRGVYARPKKSKYVGEVLPCAEEIIEVMAKERGEILQVHGAVASNRFKLSTQVPMKPIYYTSGPTREISVRGSTVTLKHVNRRKLQLAGKRSGMALSALWYAGKENMNEHTVRTVTEQLTGKELGELMNSSMPAWMSGALKKYGAGEAHA